MGKAVASIISIDDTFGWISWFNFIRILLTAIGNLEQVMFGKGFQTKLPETVFAMIIAIAASGSVHRVCATTCLIFSLVMVYSMYKISQQVYGHSEIEGATTKVAEKSKKKK